MGILNSLIGGSANGVIKEVGSIIDELHTSTEEKMRLKKDLELVFNDRMKIKSSDDISLRGEITKRWNSDSNSDTKLAKLIRPVTLILWTLILMLVMVATIFMNMESVQLETLGMWMPLIQTIVVTIYGAYFGGRSLEKIIHRNTRSKEVGSAMDYIKTIDATKIISSNRDNGDSGNEYKQPKSISKYKKDDKNNDTDLIDAFTSN